MKPLKKHIECDDKRSEPDHSYSFAFLATFLINGVIVFILICIAFGGGLKEGESPSPMQFFITTLVSLLVLNAIVFQILVSQRQWKTMREGLEKTQSLLGQNDQIIETMRGQLEVMQHSAERNDRPILSVALVQGTVSKNSPVTPRVTITNKGRTPARDVEIAFRAVEGGDGFWNEDDYTDRAEKFSVPYIFAGHSIEFLGGDSMVWSGEAEFVENDISWEKQIYVFGDGSYKDMVGKEYLLERWVYRYQWGQSRFEPDYSIPILDKSIREAFERKIHEIEAAARKKYGLED